jgi:predicted TIM-barrel fold metal-dependent hydrolase
VTPTTAIGEKNAWRLETPGSDGWGRSLRPGAARRYLVLNTDSHANEPPDPYTLGGIAPEFRSRVPHLETDADGNQWMICEGWRPQLVKAAPGRGPSPDEYDLHGIETSFQMWSDRMEPDDLHRMTVASARNPDESGLANRRRDADLDGIDAEIVFPNRGLLAFATPDAAFSVAMCRAWNRWAWDVYASSNDRFRPMAMIAPARLDDAVEDVRRAAETGFRGLLLPAKPIWGPPKEGELHYNRSFFDPLWAAISETGLPVTIHVATGRDPRAAGGSGGALINLAIGSLTQVIEPLACILSSGVLHRFPELRVGTVEGGIGWVPWLLQTLDEAYRKHHMWVSPVSPEPPSFYYRRQCFSTFVEDAAGLALAEEWGLIDNVMWSNDYPHHEGSWPHSAEAIERQLGRLSEAARAKVLGLNAARVFGFPVPLHRA